MSIFETLTPQEWIDFDKRTQMEIDKIKHQEELAEQRVERALKIKKDDIWRKERSKRGQGWIVRSQTDPNATYQVTPTFECTCLGYQYRKWCKHSDACKEKRTD